jgi:hypothetical protein
MISPEPYVLEQGLRPSTTRCFLCGAAEVITKEHVFPKWLLNRFDLWDEPLTLLNGTGIRYRQLVIPCCQRCNNEHLSPVENRVQAAFAAGPSALADLPQPDLYLWMVKIYYGLLFRNLTLPVDQRNTLAGPIVTPQDLSRFRILHLMLQGLRGVDVKMLHAGTPGSCVIAPAQTSTLGHASLNWDYLDVPHAPFLAVRVGHVAVFAGLIDSGAFLHFAKETQHFNAARELRLHPAQFQELAVLFAAIAMRVSERREFEVQQHERGFHITFDESTAERSIEPFMSEPEFLEQWAALARLCGDIESRPGRMRTSIIDEAGNPLVLSLEADILAGRLHTASQARRRRSVVQQPER